MKRSPTILLVIRLLFAASFVGIISILFFLGPIKKGGEGLLRFFSSSQESGEGPQGLVGDGLNSQEYFEATIEKISPTGWYNISWVDRPGDVVIGQMWFGPQGDGRIRDVHLIDQILIRDSTGISVKQMKFNWSISETVITITTISEKGRERFEYLEVISLDEMVTMKRKLRFLKM